MKKSIQKSELLQASRINYHHLHYFWAVAKEGNLTRTAELLHVSQSALSAQIRQLETQLGLALFAREGRRLAITEAGQMVLRHAEGIFAMGAELVASVQGQGQTTRQKLRIGSVATLSRNFQENLLRPILADDSVQLSLESGTLDELLARLIVHKLDLVLSNRPVARDAEHPWRCRRIARQPVILVGPGKSKPARPFRFPQDAQGQDIVLPGQSSDIRSRFDSLCEQLGLQMRIRAEVEDMAMLRLIARDSGALALVPGVVVQDELKSGILRELCRVPQVEESFYAITVPRKLEPPALKTLLHLQNQTQPKHTLE
jgi:LysR family transcriptional regulator, transcriptional activator of nhaA